MGTLRAALTQELQQKVEQTQATLETEDPNLIQALNREDLLGDLFYAGMLGYYGQFTALSNLTGAQQDGHTLLLGGLGIHGYEPRVNTLFGFPRSISPGGVIFDIPIAMVNLTDGMDQDSNRRYQQQIGQISSTFEHEILEQMLGNEGEPVEAISTIKAFGKANDEGQSIYEMTRENMAQTMPNLNLDSETESAIEQALSAGLEVIAHTDPVDIPGWTGAGYMVLNPITGAGAYLISGGQNGGNIDLSVECSQTCKNFGIVMALIAASAVLVALVSALIAGGLIFITAFPGAALTLVTIALLIPKSLEIWDECSESFTAIATIIAVITTEFIFLLADNVTQLLALVFSNLADFVAPDPVFNC